MYIYILIMPVLLLLTAIANDSYSLPVISLLHVSLAGLLPDAGDRFTRLSWAEATLKKSLCNTHLSRQKAIGNR